MRIAHKWAQGWKAFSVTWLDIAIPLILVASTVGTVARKFDLTDWDEAAYFQYGYSLQTTPDAAAWSPSYSWLYSAGRLVSGDVIQAAFIGRLTGCLVFVLGVWLAARLVSDPVRGLLVAGPLPWISTWIIWTGVSSFSAGLLALSVAIAYRWRHSWGFAVAALLAWLAAIARPEFQPVAVFCTVVVVWRILRLTPRSSPSLLQITPVALSMGIPLLVWSQYAPPVTTASTGRLWLAFGQHHALQRVGNSGLDPWDQWAVFTRADFGDSTSIVQAAVVNPAAMLGHLTFNVWHTPWNLVASILDRSSITSWIAMAVLVAEMLIVLAFLAQRRVTLLKRENFIDGKFVWMGIAGLSAIMVGVDVLVIYPEEHYFAPLVGVGFVLLAIGLRSIDKYWNTFWVQGLIFTCVAMLAFAGLGAIGSVGTAWSSPRPYVSAVRLLNTCPASTRIYAMDYGPVVYAPALELVSPQPAAKDGPSAFLRKEGIDVIYLTPLLISRWPKEYWTNFAAQPSKYGFRQIPYKGAKQFAGQSSFFVSESAGC